MKKRQLRKNKNKFKIISLFFVILLVAFMGMFFLCLGRGSQSQAKSNKTETSITTEHASQNSDKQVIYPTIYITGSGGSVTSVNWLVDRVMPIQNVTAKKSLVMIADITKNYQLKVTGQVSKDNKYPLIEFGTGKGTDSGTVFSKGLQRAVAYLTEHYRVPWINLVGFSSGGTGAIYYMIDTANSSKFPPVNKYASLDGEYNKEVKLQAGETLADVLKRGPLVKTAMYNYIADNYNKVSNKTEMMLLEGDFNTAQQTDNTIPWADSFSIYHLFKENGNDITTTLYPTKMKHGQAPKNPIAVKYIKDFIYGTP